MFSLEVATSSPPERRVYNGHGQEADAMVSRVDVHERTTIQILNVMNEGIGSVREVDFLAHGIARPSSALLSLSLHSNRVSSLEGLASLTALTDLNLSSNELDGAAIRSCAPHLGALSSLESLDLSCNRVDALLGLPFLPRLRRLLVPYNRLVSLDGVQALASSLTYLDARDNRIAGPVDAHAPHLAALGRLKSLLLRSPCGGQANPVCTSPGYRSDLFAAAPALEMLDGGTANALEAAVAVAVAGVAQPPAATTGVATVPRNPRLGGSRRGQDAVVAGKNENALTETDRSYTAGGIARGGVGQGAVEAGAAPEIVPMPRFDALAGRFRRRRGRLGRGGERGLGEGSEGSPRVSPSSVSVTDSVNDGWSEGDDGQGRAWCDADRPRQRGGIHPEETPGRAVRSGDGGGSGRGGGGDAGAGVEEDGSEEQGLLSRLRSVAQEARLEVMDSRLQDLHEKQAEDAAGARKTAASATPVPTVAFSGSIGPTSRQGGGSRASAARGGGKRSPWARHTSGAGRHVVRGGFSGVANSTLGSRIHAAGARRLRQEAPLESITAGDKWDGGGGSDYRVARVDASFVVGAADPSSYAKEDPLGCPCCGNREEPEMAVASAGGRRGAGRNALEGAGRSNSRFSDISVPKSLSDASTQANRGPGTVAVRPTDTPRMRRLAGRPSVVSSSGGGARVDTTAGRGAVKVGGAVAAAAVVGAAAAAVSEFSKRRLAVSFFRWARDTEHAKSAEAAMAAERDIAAAREEAEREREAWESLRKTLEGSAAAREREAGDTAEEKAREEIQSLAAARRSAEEGKGELREQLAQAEANAAIAVRREEQAQADRRQAHAELVRAKADSEATAAASKARENARAERLEEQLRGKARAESEAEEECRRVRVLLREAESRCRGLQDQVEESRTRERRSAADAEDARRRAAAQADTKLAAAVDAERERFSALKHKLEQAEDSARVAASKARAAAEGEVRGRRAAVELAELAREQKAALQMTRGQVRTTRAESDTASEAVEVLKAELAKTATEMKALRGTVEARDEELSSERRARRQQQEAFEGEVARAKVLEEARRKAETKLAASAGAQGDLRAAVMVKDKVLEDREKLIMDLREREDDALAEARDWRDRLEAAQSDADRQLDAAKEEVSELQAQVVALSGVEDELREVFKELRRYRKRHADEDADENKAGVAPRDGVHEGDGGEFTAVAAVTAAAKAVEEELRGQLEARDQALRYVENELLGMKSLFDSKEACLRQELSEERDRLAREADVLKQQVEEATAGRAAAGQALRQHASVVDALRSRVRFGDRRSQEYPTVRGSPRGPGGPGKGPGMKIDVGEGTRAAGEDRLVYGVTRSDSGSTPIPNRAVAQGPGSNVEGMRGGDEGGATVLNCTTAGGPHSKRSLTVTLSVQSRNVDGSANIGSNEHQEDGMARMSTTTLSALDLKRNNVAPPEENGSPGSSTPPTDAGGDPCPSCSTPAMTLSTTDDGPHRSCRCGRVHAGDKAQGGYTGGEPVAAADAVALESRVGRDGEGTVARNIAKEVGMVAPEPGHGMVRVVGEAMRAGLTTAGISSLSAGNGGGVRASVPNPVEATACMYDVRPATDCDNSMMVDVGALPEEASGEGAAAAGGRPQPNAGVVEEESAAGHETLSVHPQGPVDPRAASVMTTDAIVAGQGEEAGKTHGQQAGESQADTMNRLAESLAQARHLAMSIEARQTELLARPKRRPHPSAKQESTAQPRKVRPKGSSSQAKPPKLEDLRVKVEPSDADPAAASIPLMPKQRLLIKIPRSAVTAATAHAAEIAAAEAASARAAATVKKEATDVRTSKRSKGKGGVKRARPLAGTRASSPPPPPPAPTNRQGLPPGCGPPCPGLAGIFGREVDEDELEIARDGVEHLETSQASRRLTALASAVPKELASHVQALRLDYLVQKVRPILTKLMSAGTGPQRGLFNVPVDPVKLGIPDYFKRVLSPMDLGTIKSRLLSMCYNTPEAFASDVRLVFTNAISFNPESHFVHTWAVHLLNEFDQEYSKQIGKLDEGWAKSLSHACQLCQGQTCTLCGDKCLKLEPPVIICQHCNKRVIRGGVYHITRDGCRLWCSRCHPGLPPELPTDCDPESINPGDVDSVAGGAEEAPNGGGGGAEAGELGDATSPNSPLDILPTPLSTGDASGDGGSSTAAATRDSSLSPPPQPALELIPDLQASATGEASEPTLSSTAGGVADAGSGTAVAAAGESCSLAAVRGGICGNRPEDSVDGGSTAGVAEVEVESAGGRETPRLSESEGGGCGAGGPEGFRAPLKRDLLRRKFDEEISEPWVQCDRCNSWVHQVCALFNARANVGEARFVCPLCRLRNVTTPLSAPAIAADHTVARKRPKSFEGSGRHSPCAAKSGEGAASTPADAGRTRSPVNAEETTADTVNAVGANGPGGVAGGTTPMEGVVATPPSAATATAAEATSCAATYFVHPPGAPPECPAVQTNASPSGSTPVSRPASSADCGAFPDAKVPTLPCQNSCGATAAVAGGVVASASGASSPLQDVVGNDDGKAGSGTAASSAPATTATAATVAAQELDEGNAEMRRSHLSEHSAGAVGEVKAAGGTAPARDVSGTVAAGEGASPLGIHDATVDGVKVEAAGEKQQDGVEADVGAEAAGDASRGSAASDNFDVYAASSLPHTPLSRYIESRVRQRLAQLENDAAAATLSIRLISNVEATCEVHAVLRETFCCKDGHGVGPNKSDVPELLKYRSKALSMFQRVDGVEVCLFSMYVQEYGADAPYFNARRAYISYLDSVEYFRPRKHRTAVYHEILVAYLDWIRRRGFKAAHIWSCPPQRGNNFIFWCHPLHQKTPTRDRLSGWYGNMLKRAAQLGVAAKITTLDKTHFTEVERIGILLKNRRTSAAASAAASLAGVKGPDDLPLRPEIPVIFEGDFWAEEAVRLARAVDRKDEGAEDGQSPLELSRQALEELIRHQQGAPFAAPVDPARDRCPDYLSVIEQPMDLGTVAETLDAMKYHDAGAFVSDVRLIFENAKKYNPPKHPIHVAASKLTKIFDKTVRALESAVNRLPGMHEMGLEHLILEEPPPPAPPTPTAGATTAPGATPAPVTPHRPTAPGKTSIPWAFDAIGPLSQLARQTWAAHSARTARTVGVLPPMLEESAADLPSPAPACRSGSGGGGITSMDTGSEYGSGGSDRLHRSGSTAVMSVSEFYGPNGARMLQRRGSTASALSFADSYGDADMTEASRDENCEGNKALSMLMADGSEGEQHDGSTAPGGGNSDGDSSDPQQGEQSQPSPTPLPVPPGSEITTGGEVTSPGVPNAWSTLSWPGQSAASMVEVNGESGQGLPTSTPTGSTPASATTPSTAVVASEGMTAVTQPASGEGVGTARVAAVAGSPAVAQEAAGLGDVRAELETQAAASSADLAVKKACAPATPETLPDSEDQANVPPPLTLEAPHPCARDNDDTVPTPRPTAQGGPAASLSLLRVPTVGGAVEPVAGEGQHQRVGIIRAMSVDSVPPQAPVMHSRAFSMGAEGLAAGRGTSGSDTFGIAVGASGNSGGVASLTGGTVHSPRLRAKSMDSGGRKGKSKRGKGPGAAVMGKADRIGRMLQSLSRAVTRISKDLLVVTLGEPDRPAKPPTARGGSGATAAAMLAELEAWHASSGLDGVLTPDCHDPDPPISRALVDARHTFLEMCQYRHYQFDTLRRAKHSSAMVLYHLHRPESRSLNPFCSRCHRPVRFVRYHCGVCNYDLCSGCDEDVGTKCEDGHDLTPYRVTFSTEDAEISPDAGCTPATGGTSLSPCMSPTRSRERVCASPGRIIAGLQPSEVGGGENTRAVPSTLPADNEIGESPPTRDLSGEGGATVDTSSSVCAAIAMEMDVDPAKEEGVVAGEPVNGVLEMMALGDGGEQVHVEPPPVDVGGGEGEELAPQPIGGRP